jgi:uncharacterized integral membrane protein
VTLKRLKLIVVAILLVVVIVLVLQNKEPTEVQLLWAKVQVSRMVLLLVTFLVGACCGLLAASNLLRRSKR